MEMAKWSMRFDRYIKIQENQPVENQLEEADNWVDVGKVRKCSFKYDSGEDYKTEFAEKVLLTATVRLQHDPTINETMRVVLLGGGEAFKIIAVLPTVVNGRKLTQLKVQRWAML